MSNRLSDIQFKFLYFFVIFSIFNSIVRIAAYSSFRMNSYLYIALALLIIYFTILYTLKRTKTDIVLLFTIQTIIFFGSHYFFVMGTYLAATKSYIWLFLPPIMCLIYFPIKKVITLSLPILISILFLPKIAEHTGILDYYDTIYTKKTNEQTDGLLANIIWLAIFFYYCITLYYIYRYLRIKSISDIQVEEIEQYVNHIAKVEKNTQSNFKSLRLTKTYQAILNYLETNKSYTDPDYSLDQLAIDIQINRTYVSKSLNLIGNTSFTDLINQYRINAAKEFFVNDTFRTQNIKQIYYSVGFRHQSTFNRAFKKCEGITPSEFIIKIESVQNKNRFPKP